jgi:hypothetical protein
MHCGVTVRKNRCVAVIRRLEIFHDEFLNLWDIWLAMKRGWKCCEEV